jgi:hypothetical protein
MALCPNEEALSNLRATVKCEGPTDKIYQFDGNITVESDGDQKLSLCYENFLLRGSSLR